MHEAAVDFVLAVLVVVGVPALFVVFLLKGAIIGKPFPSTVLLPGYLIAVSATPLQTAGVLLTTATAYTCGQLALYGGARRHGLDYVRSAPRVTVSDRWLARSEALFSTYGGASVFFTNFVPYIRGLAVIPAGAAGYPAGRTAVYTFLSVLLYHALIVAAVVGSFRAVV